MFIFNSSTFLFPMHYIRHTCIRVGGKNAVVIFTGYGESNTSRKSKKISRIKRI